MTRSDDGRRWDETGDNLQASGVDPEGAGIGAEFDGSKGAALSYPSACANHADVDSAALDAWCASSAGRAGLAQLFRDVHRSDPRATDRLALALTTMPEVGREFLGFRLIGELGRGAFGRVYLARQGDLAGRPVALKVTLLAFDEAQTLAQLQHTNIVPIYSVHRVEQVQAVCMPYFGSTTLGDIYDDIASKESLPVSGLDLLKTLNGRKSGSRTREDPAPFDVEPAEGAAMTSEAPSVEAMPRLSSGPSTGTLKLLGGLSYIEAILWIAARLADGLGHAHERSILHLDLKPANILLTDDGQPMLLDFNLSKDFKALSGAAAEIGGTLPYMSPEHLVAYRGGGCELDARSDLYSFGIILYELLTGRRPFAIPDGPQEDLLDRMISDRLGPPPDVRPWNRAVTPAVESMVHHCLEPDPDRRYQTARELQEDLERHLSHRPLKHAPEPSLRERSAKWARLHPAMCGTTSVTTLALVLIASILVGAWLMTEELRNAGARLHHRAFGDTFEECQLLLNTHGGPPEHLDRGIRLARQALAGYGLGESDDWTAVPLGRRLPDGERRSLRDEVAELVLLEARAGIVLARRNGSADDLERALRRGVDRLDRIERFGLRPPAALYDDRGAYHAALGRGDLAARDHALAGRVPPASARDFYLLGTSLLARGRPDRAELPLSRAITLDPDQFWAWFALGICHSDQGRPHDAAYDFSVCTTLAPGFAWPHLNRGLALARSGRLPEARVAYDHALELAPDFIEALVDRALACLELDDSAQAAHDLKRALDLGRRTTAVLTARGEALARLGRRDESEAAFAEAIRSEPGAPMPWIARGYARLTADRPGAEADFSRALELDPTNTRARLGRALLLRQDAPRAALIQVEAALAANPDYGDALQLRALLRARLGDPGAEMDVDRLLRVSTPHRLYNAACALAILSRTADAPRLVPRALDLLQRALESGLPLAGLANDPDLDALRADPRFTDMLNRQLPISSAPTPVRAR